MLENVLICSSLTLLPEETVGRREEGGERKRRGREERRRGRKKREERRSVAES